MEERRNLPFGGLSANALRLLAMGFMLLDHMWATIVPGNLWMTCVGRLAFPIFAFQIVEGYRHSSDLKRYKQRLLLFGLLSELPFNLVIAGGWVYPFHQNVLFTLLLGLMVVEAVDHRKEHPWKSMGLLALWVTVAQLGMTDYGAMGVLMVLGFFLFRESRILQFVMMLLLNWIWFKGRMLPLNLFGLAWEVPLQAFALLALPLIWLYNGEKGRGGRVMSRAGYWFYPLHMLILGLLVRVM